MATVVFIPFPIMSHLIGILKTAERMVELDERLSIKVLLMKLHNDTKISSFINSSPHPRINFVHLQENKSVLEQLTRSPQNMLNAFVDSQKGLVRDAVAEIIKSYRQRIGGFVIDMLCPAMIDVANHFGAPSCIYLPNGATAVGLILRSLESREYENPDAVISVSTYVNPVPAKIWPSPILDKEPTFIAFMSRFREYKGIILNTFPEFEPHAFTALSADEKFPQIYPVGPLLQEETDEQKQNKKNREIMAWLDEQPDSSVVFLCFGSLACFPAEQAKETAVALEKSGHRFLWSLRKPPPKDNIDFPGEYENPGEVLPEGFLERTAGIGKVLGWAPQIAVLSHPAVGGFVSHCGWNSIMESVWCGVPMAVWPLISEQQAHAFQLVKEIGMAVEIKMDYRKDCDVIVAAEEIEKAVRELMDQENKIRVKAKELQEKSRKALMEGGSSDYFVGRLVNGFMENTS